MRILLCHSGNDLYGASRSLLRLAHGLHHAGHEVCVILPVGGPLESALKSRDISTYILPSLVLHRSEIFSGKLASWLLKAPSAISAHVKFCRQFRPDLIHSNTGTVLTGALAAAWCRIPHVWHIRDFFLEFGTLWQVYGRFIAGLSSRIIAVSHAVAEQFEKIPLRPHQLMVIPNGLPMEEFPEDPSNADRHRLRREWNFPDSTCVLGMPGRIKLGRKGQDLLIAAAARITGRDFKIVMAGAPFPGNESHLQQLKQQIRELHLEERILVLEELEDPRPLYRALDGVILASNTPEPFAGVVLEAMAMGKPVIGIAMGGTPEQIQSEVTGLLIPADKPDALAQAMIRLIDHPQERLRMGSLGRKRFEECFSFSTMFPKIEKCIQDAVDAHKD